MKSNFILKELLRREQCYFQIRFCTDFHNPEIYVTKIELCHKTKLRIMTSQIEQITWKIEANKNSRVTNSEKCYFSNFFELLTQKI